MNQRPRVSIVVTNHDYAQFVTDAVDSALAQADAAVEVIVVDDGSTDESLALLAPYRRRVRLVAQPNGGQAAAFNAGWTAASGDAVIFLDADDLLEPDVAERVVRVFDRDPEVVKVQFPLHVIDAAGHRQPITVPRTGVRLANGDVRARLTRHPDDLVWMPTSGNAFRADVLTRIMPMPTPEYRICADYYLSNLTAAHGKVAVLDRPGGSYRVHGANAHYAERWSMDAVRANVTRTSVTHRHLIEECRKLGLPGLPDDPDAVRSVTAAAFRLVSLRLDAARHPVACDTRRGLTRLGMTAALGRRDVRPSKRAGMALWFVAAGVAPRSTVPRLARPFVRTAP
jgi:glycosyltransferase involved in cell wall biosynthesis